MWYMRLIVAHATLAGICFGLQYRKDLVDWNLNTAEFATSVLDYDSSRSNTTYSPSPPNWRALPFYTVLLDKFADGDPTNNDFFGSVFEHDWRETGLRFGGDVLGLQHRLDYLQGMGIRGIFIAGTPFVNMPWQADAYSPIDFSTLDPHWGRIDDWHTLIDEIHARGMYIMLDFTVGTLGDFIGFEGHKNKSTPFNINEYNTVWKRPSYAPWGIDKYSDFKISNDYNSSCELPALWDETGQRAKDIPSYHGCKASDFDAYGDMEAFGVHPDWQRQLSKFASVQDRLREWQPSVLKKIEVFPCLIIKALDIDAIRIDKATQVTLDALADWATSTRSCAKKLGKSNFLITGEVTGGDTFGSLYYGRGRTPTQLPTTFENAAKLTPDSVGNFLRDASMNGLDAVAFHYSIYRSLTRFLGMDGNLQVAFDVNVNFVNAWHQMFLSNDFLNANTGALDPRHMYGSSNFDVFRWPGLEYGIERSALATFIATMLMPGINLIYYGEEQNFYLHDNSASNYLFGRQAMSSNIAWQTHGCYSLGSTQYYEMPLRSSLTGCQDDWNSLDHFDPTAATRRLMGHFHTIRASNPAIRDGFQLVQAGNWTRMIQLPGSNSTPTEIGLWTATRAAIPNVQNFTDSAFLVYTNENVSKTWSFSCAGESGIFVPYKPDIVLKNLLYPFENYTLEVAGRDDDQGQTKNLGCIRSLDMLPYGYKALVPSETWVSPVPQLSKFSPGHDARLLVEPTDSNWDSISIALEFTEPMNCQSVTDGLSLNVFSSRQGKKPAIDTSSIRCEDVQVNDTIAVAGYQPSSWSWSARLINVPDGVVTLTIQNVVNSRGDKRTGTVDKLMIRKGSKENAIVNSAFDYDPHALEAQGDDLRFTHKALGASKLRYSCDFGRSWSQWRDWEDATIISGDLLRSKERDWEGHHVLMQYWSNITLSSTVVVHADLDYPFKRRVPHFLVRGPFNMWGFDAGIPSTMVQVQDDLWELEVMDKWPSNVQLNVFGYSDYFYGDTDGDGIMERLPPNSAAPNYLNLSAPPYPHLSWTLVVNDSSLRWSLTPKGHSAIGAAMFTLLAVMPVLTAIAAVMIFRWSFYGIKHNEWGFIPSRPPYYSLLPGFSKNKHAKDYPLGSDRNSDHVESQERIGWPELPTKRRKVLIATLEYEIMDWNCKVKIGGLGVMATLMGKAMTDVDLIWVVPKVGDIEYPPGEPSDPFEVVIFGERYLVEVETHNWAHIKYIILDSPVFRAQTKADPYPSRMDDLSSAIFYSTWNQAIAATIRRFPAIDVYHINDYHGALAPIYLLPKVIPVCLSLHNAEFQGLWPLRTREEMQEVCAAFNISKAVCSKYVQFGNTFNLLHTAASFISVHQRSVGVAGVSDKYGKRSWARYPALWTLKHVDSLPNPDPSDIEALEMQPKPLRDIEINLISEAARPELKRQAQEWAGIRQDHGADLFVFVGRWSKQKGVDLIADVMPSILEKRPSVQLIAVGPVIDLYGRFAAEKLARLMELYPERVYSKPEFTVLPPFIFSGADFALMPSRDEPFGLVAVEFGRKGALGVGSRLGGLGLMPGWWFPVESTSTTHMLSQLTKTIKRALKSTEHERAILRARSAAQRFPVIEWRQRMEDTHRRSITISRSSAGTNAYRETDCDGALPSQSYMVYLDAAAGLTDPALAVNDVKPTSEHVDRAVAQTPAPREHAEQARWLLLLPPAIRRYLNVPSFTEPLAASQESTPFLEESQHYQSIQSAIPAADGHVVHDYVLKLQSLSVENSKGDLSIEKYLVKSEEAFFDHVRKEKLSTAMSVRSTRRDSSFKFFEAPSEDVSIPRAPRFRTDEALSTSDQLLNTTAPKNLHKEVHSMGRIQILLQRELWGWPLYTMIIAMGQMFGATSFQITLLSGRNSQSDLQLYVLGAVFLAASFVWYTLFRLQPSVHVLSLPWFFFSLALFIIGIPALSSSPTGVHESMANVATWCYAAFSAAAFIYFGLNFGEEAGSSTETWGRRACVVQGSQQIWVAVLWYWGNSLNGSSIARPPRWIVLIVWPLSLMGLAFSYLLRIGLPDYYRQVPPKIPNFLHTLFRRKIVLWFLASELLRDYWLSGPYGRNWSFLWNTSVSTSATVGLIVLFFIGIWIVILLALSHHSKVHTWLIPVFAVGLGAPRWCQMMWGTSSLALYVPWAGNAGPYLATSLWLWLGVLDSVQGVGLGMILLQTLSRLHLCATLALAQVFGSICVMIARATAPNSIGPGTVFPDAGKWDFHGGLRGSPMASGPFWIALFSQITIVAGYFWFYRREQLARP